MIVNEKEGNQPKQGEELTEQMLNINSYQIDNSAEQVLVCKTSDNVQFDYNASADCNAGKITEGNQTALLDLSNIVSQLKVSKDDNSDRNLTNGFTVNDVGLIDKWLEQGQD